jgi:hypothetical protein
VSIPGGYRLNFQTMLRAAQDGQLALMECTEKATGLSAFVVCMVNPPDEEDGEVEFVPVARLFDGNPYDEVDPPA